MDRNAFHVAKRTVTFFVGFKKVKEDNWSPTHRNVCNVYKKQKAWQKQKTGLEKANKQPNLQDTNTLTHFRTINTLQYAEYMMG